MLTSFFTQSLIALGFGLRHGLDADHIVAIDNVTRQLQSENKNSKIAGLFFALGHSTIVFFLTLFIVLGVKNIHTDFDFLQKIGSVTGSVLSTVFLWITAGVNIHALFFSGKKHTHSVFFNMFNINHPYKIYVVGFLFGLGFDTATEVGLLGMSAASALQGYKTGLILVLPFLFTIGMVATDLLDSYFMSSLYCMTNQKRAYFQRYYRAIILITTLLALLIGAAEFISIINFEYTGIAIVVIFFGIFCYVWLDARNSFSRP